jgi:hypothetical protein
MSEAETDDSPHAAVLLENGGQFFFYQPGLGIIASGDSVKSTYDKFIETRRDYIQEIKRAGLSSNRHLTSPLDPWSMPFPSGSRSVAAELGLFLLKTCIVLLIIGAVSIAGLIGAKQSVVKLAAFETSVIQTLSGSSSPSVKALQKISLVDAISKLAQHVEAMPESRKEQLRQSIAILSRESEPLIEAWRHPQLSQKAATPPKAPASK